MLNIMLCIGELIVDTIASIIIIDTVKKNSVKDWK